MTDIITKPKRPDKLKFIRLPVIASVCEAIQKKNLEKSGIVWIAAVALLPRNDGKSDTIVVLFVIARQLYCSSLRGSCTIRHCEAVVLFVIAGQLYYSSLRGIAEAIQKKNLKKSGIVWIAAVALPPRNDGKSDKLLFFAQFEYIYCSTNNTIFQPYTPSKVKWHCGGSLNK